MHFIIFVSVFSEEEPDLNNELEVSVSILLVHILAARTTARAPGCLAIRQFTIKRAFS